MSSIGTKRLTFDEWQALPETNQIREVVDGEVLSPSNTRREIEERLSDFRSIGVPEGWLGRLRKKGGRRTPLGCRVRHQHHLRHG